MDSLEIADAISKVKRATRGDLESADAISKLWWPKRARSTRLKDFAEARARHNRALKDLSVPDYIRESLAANALPKVGRHYKVTREQAMAYYRRFVEPMPKDWYIHRDANGHWQKTP